MIALAHYTCSCYSQRLLLFTATVFSQIFEESQHSQDVVFDSWIQCQGATALACLECQMEWLLHIPMPSLAGGH